MLLKFDIIITTVEIKKLKRILLVLPQYFNYNNNTGITLQSIFRNYDEESIAEVVLSEKLSAKPLKNSFLFTVPERQKESGFILFRKISSLIYIKKALNNYELNEFVESFNPELIYCICCFRICSLVALHFKIKYKIPVIVHHYDNVKELSQKNYIDKFVFDSLEKGMKCGLVISDEMKERYQKEYKHKYTTLMSSVAYREFDTKEKSSDKIKFIYAGGLHLNRLDSLKDIADCLKKIDKNGLDNTNLDVYSPDYDKYEDLIHDDVLHIHKGLSRDEIIELYSEFDVLVHVEPFDESLFDFLKYSISTKLPEYLISGRIILCYAPRDAAITKFIANNSLGYVASNKDELYSAINNIFNNPEQTKMLIRNAYEMAVERFTHEASFKILKKVIEENTKKKKNKSQ